MRQGMLIYVVSFQNLHKSTVWNWYKFN